MARKPLSPAALAPASFDASVDAVDRQAANQLAVIQHEGTERARALAKQMGYEGSLAPDVLEEIIEVAMRRTAEAAFATGIALLMLKEVSPHGEFLERVKRRGLDTRLAQRLMSAATKLSKSGDATAFLDAAGSKSKLLELITLDEDGLDMLAQGGEVNGLTLDKISTMSVRELKEALREKEAELQVSQESRLKLANQVDKLKASTKLLKSLPADERLQKMCAELEVVGHAAWASLAGGLRPALQTLVDHHADHGGDSLVPMAAAVGRVQRLLNEMREEFGLPDVSSAADEELMRQTAQWGGK